MEHPLSAPRHWLAGAAVTTILSAIAPCAHATERQAPAAIETAPPAPSGQNALVSAMGQPLADFNINPSEIPASLRKAVEAPYSLQPGASCAAMGGEIADLDDALGPDLDVDAAKTGKSRYVARAAVGAVRRLAVSWIPYRGMLRTVTGAESHDRKVQEAALAGAVRRAYLKGLGERAGCGPEAAPHRAMSVNTPDPAAAPPLVVALDAP